MFAHYEGEQDKKLREQAKKQPQAANPPNRIAGGPWNWALARKNQTFTCRSIPRAAFRVAGDAAAFPTRAERYGPQSGDLKNFEPAL
jgi:hypothetical protein